MEKESSKFTLRLKKNFGVKSLVVNALIAALYAVITIACGPLSYNGGMLQLRFSEILNLLVFFNPTYSLGLTIGCLIANLMSFYGLPDIILGTLGTLISCLIMIVIAKFIKNLFLCGLIPCLINALLVPVIVYLYSIDSGMSASVYFISFGWTFLGEFICIMCIGYPIFMILAKKYKGFSKLINGTMNEKFLF